MISGDFIGGQTENQKFSIVNIGQVAKVLSCVKIIPFQASSYRWPNGPDTTGGTTHDTKKHDTNTNTIA
jgi:hypothetical protein